MLLLTDRPRATRAVGNRPLPDVPPKPAAVKHGKLTVAIAAEGSSDTHDVRDTPISVKVLIRVSGYKHCLTADANISVTFSRIASKVQAASGIYASCDLIGRYLRIECFSRSYSVIYLNNLQALLALLVCNPLLPFPHPLPVSLLTIS